MREHGLVRSLELAGLRDHHADDHSVIERNVDTQLVFAVAAATRSSADRVFAGAGHFSIRLWICRD